MIQAFLGELKSSNETPLKYLNTMQDIKHLQETIHSRYEDNKHTVNKQGTIYGTKNRVTKRERGQWLGIINSRGTVLEQNMQAVALKVMAILSETWRLGTKFRCIGGPWHPF